METQLTALLKPISENQMIGPEIGLEAPAGFGVFFQSIRTFQPKAKYRAGGSYRFVRIVDGTIVAGLQVMSATGQSGTVANVYCHPDWRRRGLASELLEVARGRFPHLEFSEDRSPDGAAWVSAHQAAEHGTTQLQPSRGFR